MKPFDLDIKDRIRADLYILRFFQVSAQCFFIFFFDRHKLFENLFIILILQKLFQFCCILLVPFPDQRIDQFCQSRIAMKQPAAERNTIGLIIKFFRIDLIKVIQFRLF